MDAIAASLTGINGQTPVRVTVLSGRFQDAADSLAKNLSDKMTVAKMGVMRISPVLGVHTGPGIVGVAVLPMNLMEDLI